MVFFEILNGIMNYLIHKMLKKKYMILKILIFFMVEIILEKQRFLKYLDHWKLKRFQVNMKTRILKFF